MTLRILTAISAGATIGCLGGSIIFFATGEPWAGLGLSLATIASGAITLGGLWLIAAQNLDDD